MQNVCLKTILTVIIILKMQTIFFCAGFSSSKGCWCRIRQNICHESFKEGIIAALTL